MKIRELQEIVTLFYFCVHTICTQVWDHGLPKKVERFENYAYKLANLNKKALSVTPLNSLLEFLILALKDSVGNIRRTIIKKLMIFR